MDKISHGGMGEVYKAKSFGVQGFEKLFAIKRILPKLSKTNAFIDMLADEAKIIVSLNHSNIAQVFEFNEVEKIYYLAMEFIHGKDLRSIMEKTENVPIEIAAYLIAELCKGLHYLHNVKNETGQKLNIVHRDISPRNIIVSFEGEVKIIDFGIANASNRAFTIGNDIFVGKYSYMSPEQLLGKELSHKSDIFSAGIVLYELIFGKLPPGKIKDRNLLALDKENIDVDPALEKKLLAKLPDELRATIEKAVAVNPQDRYENALLLYNDLMTFISHYQKRVDSFILSHYIKNLFSSEMYGARENLAAPAEDKTFILEEYLTAFSERKKVAVLNVTITPLSLAEDEESKDRERSMMLDVFKEVLSITQKNGGLIYRLKDTDLIAVFGLPKSREDDIQRALFCALQIQDHINATQTKCKVKIALDFGTVIVTFKDQDLRNFNISEGPEKKVKKIVSIARDREILFGSGIEAIAGMQFDIEEIDRKGIRCFRLIDIKETLKGYLKKIEVQEKFINREKELELIEKDLSEVNFDKGTVVFLTGEAGIGKTALTQEIAHRASKENIQVFIQSFHPYIKTPYSIFKQTIFQVLSLESMDKTLFATKISELAGFGLTKTELDALRNIFSIKYKNPSFDALSPQKQKLVILFALRKIIGGLANQKTIFILEDLHFADELSLEVLDLILANGPLPNILFIKTHRPEFSYNWQYKDLLSHSISLEPFNENVLNTYVTTLTSGIQLTLSSLFKIYTKSGGNPLFTQELIKSLLDEKKMHIVNNQYTLLDGAESYLVPDTLYGLIAARIDSLPQELKTILQLISIIGKDFSVDQIKNLMPTVEMNLSEKLIELQSRGIIREKEVSPELTYEITHSLMREVTYKNLTPTYRRLLHTKLATYLETKYTDELDEHTHFLAYHYARSNNSAKALEYLMKAGDEANKLYLLSEANRYYIEAIASFVNNEELFNKQIRKLIELNYKVGTVNQILGKLDISTKSLEEALELSQKYGISEFIPKSYHQIARIYKIKGDYEKVLYYIDQAIKASEETQNQRNRLELLHEQAGIYRLQQNKERALEILEHGLLEAQRIGDKYIESMYLNHLGITYENLQQHRKALECYKQTLELRKEQKDKLAISIVLANIAALLFKINKVNKSIEYAKKSLHISSEIEDKLGECLNLNNLGEIYLSMNSFDKAKNYFERALQEAQEISWKEGMISSKIHISLINTLKNDKIDESRTMLEEAFLALKELHHPEYIAKAYLVKSKLLHITHEEQSSQECFAEAQEIIKQNNLNKTLKSFEQMLEH